MDTDSPSRGGESPTGHSHLSRNFFRQSLSMKRASSSRARNSHCLTMTVIVCDQHADPGDRFSQDPPTAVPDHRGRRRGVQACRQCRGALGGAGRRVRARAVRSARDGSTPVCRCAQLGRHRITDGDHLSHDLRESRLESGWRQTFRFVEGSGLMRIAMVVTGGLHPSGRQQVVPSLLALFSRLARDHEVHAFAVRHLRHASTYMLLGFTVHDLGRPSAPFGLTRWAQERALRKAMSASGPFDLVHGFWGDPAGLLAARAGRHFGIPSIVSCDSGEFVSIPAIGSGSQRTARGRAIIHEACSLASRVHVCTRFMERQARGHGFAATVIPLGTGTRDSALENPVEEGDRAPFACSRSPASAASRSSGSLIDAWRYVATDRRAPRPRRRRHA